MLPSFIRSEIRQFHVVDVQRRQRNVQKSAMHLKSCCFADLRACLHGGGGPQVGEVTRLGWATRLAINYLDGAQIE